MSNVSSGTILFSQHGSIGTLTFNRPDVYNAMNPDLILAMRDVTAEIAASRTLRAVILKGAGKAFLAGGDVGLFYRQRENIVETVKPLGDALHAGIKNIRNMPFPVIAQIHGACAGAGLSVAIPSLMFYRYFRGLINEYVIDMEKQAIALMDVLDNRIAEMPPEGEPA